jgi:hypothetical protein
VIKLLGYSGSWTTFKDFFFGNRVLLCSPDSNWPELSV